MQNFQMQKRLILGGLTFLLLADVAFGYLAYRMSGSREERQQVLATRARELGLVRADIKRATEIRQKTPQYLKALDGFENSFLPASNGYSVVTQELDEFAKDTRLLLDNVKFQEKEASEKNLMELKVEASVNGDYQGIVEFLNHLQRSKIVYIVDALDVESQNSEKAPAGTLKVNLHLRTYFRKA